MIIDYDHNPQASIDQKLQSLMESIQLALNEIDSDIKLIEKMIEELRAGA